MAASAEVESWRADLSVAEHHPDLDLPYGVVGVGYVQPADLAQVQLKWPAEFDVFVGDELKNKEKHRS